MFLRNIIIMRRIIFLICLSVFLLLAKDLLANELPNNKFGIHLAQPHLEDIKKTAELVNGSGGDWGYITLVIQENDRNNGKWQAIFDLLREYHLIPIIRLATRAEGENWRRPEKKDAGDWVSFLDSLNWVVKERYIVLFNEPNHGSEWGGEIGAKDYGEVSFEFAKKLKEKNKDFFVMLAGFDASAPSWPPGMEDEEVFLKKIVSAKSEIFDYIDGWASHSYPNPGFIGMPWQSGRGTVKTYVWELAVLKELGVKKDLPVFVTETGWNSQKLSSETVARYFKEAYDGVWLPDSRVRAVTPFVFDYQGDPFLGFSWKLPASVATSEKTFYPQYYTVQSLPKTAGEPDQIEKGEMAVDLPAKMVAHSNFEFNIHLKNTGQGYWDKSGGYRISLALQGDKKFEHFIGDIKDLKPGQENDLSFFIKTNGNFGRSEAKLTLLKNGKPIIEGKTWKFEVLPLPSLNFKVDLLPKLKSNGSDFEIQIFNRNEVLVYKKKGLQVVNGKGKLSEVQNIIPGDRYRVVVLKPYYLPRQTHIVFKKQGNELSFKGMIAVDFDQNGKFDLQDIKTLFRNIGLLKFWLP